MITIYLITKLFLWIKDIWPTLCIIFRIVWFALMAYLIIQYFVQLLSDIVHYFKEKASDKPQTEKKSKPAKQVKVRPSYSDRLADLEKDLELRTTAYNLINKYDTICFNDAFMPGKNYDVINVADYIISYVKSKKKRLRAQIRLMKKLAMLLDETFIAVFNSNQNGKEIRELRAYSADILKKRYTKTEDTYDGYEYKEDCDIDINNFCNQLSN